MQSCVIILPSIGRSLDIPAERPQWIISAYYLTFGCFLLLWGRLADIYGRRIIFIWGSAWVTAMTIAVPFSPNEIVFDVLRGMQGLGAAANVPTAIGILGATFAPGRSKNYAFSIYSAGSSMGSVLGNLLGGVVGQYLSWKWLFWILAVLAASVTIVGEFVIPRPELEVEAVNARPNIRMDWLGGTMIVVSIVLLTFALTEGNVVGWATPLAVVAGCLRHMAVVFGVQNAGSAAYTRLYLAQWSFCRGTVDHGSLLRGFQQLPRLRHLFVSQFPPCYLLQRRNKRSMSALSLS